MRSVLAVGDAAIAKAPSDARSVTSRSRCPRRTSCARWRAAHDLDRPRRARARRAAGLRREREHRGLPRGCRRASRRGAVRHDVRSIAGAQTRWVGGQQRSGRSRRTDRRRRHAAARRRVRQAAHVRHLPRPSSARARARRLDLQIEVRPSRRQPARAARRHQRRHHHRAKPRLRGGPRIAAARRRADHDQSQRWDERRLAPPAAADRVGAVPSRSIARTDDARHLFADFVHDLEQRAGKA